MAKSDALYKDSPTTERGEDGKVKVKKPSDKKADSKTAPKDETASKGKAGEAPSKADAESEGTNGLPVVARHAMARREMTNRHVGERMAMHNRQEAEHEAGPGGNLGEVHGRHEGELKEMNGRHEKEMKSLHKSQLEGEGSPTGDGAKKVEQAKTASTAGNLEDGKNKAKA